MTKIFAHRGASESAPENTLEAFQLAMDQGADGIELDVHLTKDGELAVTHDEEIDRVSDGSGLIKDYTLEELRRFSFHNGMEAWRGVKIPTLQEVLALVKPGRMEVNIELKTGIYWYPGIEEKTLEAVRAYGMEERVIFSSFNHYSVQKMRELGCLSELAYLYSDIILDVEKYAKKTGVCGLHPAVYHLRMADFLEKYRESGRKVRVWTVNEESDMEDFIRADLEAIITNDPALGIRVREAVRRERD